MTTPSSEILELTRNLIARPSVTPEDGGCQALLAERLARVGFEVHRLRFGEVENLYAVHGRGDPLVVLLGHTDVVPPGPLEAWTSPPFEPTEREGRLYGRGAADMKSAVAALCLALERFVQDNPDHPGRVALLMTSDEEGPAKDGVVKVVEWLSARGDRIHYCLIGEPSSSQQLGDRVRVGRRGSMHGYLTVHGIQGHVAYPELARNPVHQAAPALAELAAQVFDQGNSHFPPSSFQIYEIAAGTGANNVIPGDCQVKFNFRYGTASTPESLEAQVRAVLDRHQLEYSLRFRISSLPFLTEGGRLVEAVQGAVRAECGIEPVLDTGGGTSDGRYVAPTGAEVVELGPVNASIHKVDEWVAMADLAPLVRLYEGVLRRVASD